MATTTDTLIPEDVLALLDIDPENLSFADKAEMVMFLAGAPEQLLIAHLGHGGQTWNIDQLDADFDVLQLRPMLMVVRRKADGVIGSLCHSAHARLAFDFVPLDATPSLFPVGEVIAA